MQKVAALFLRLDLFGWNPVSVCPQVLTNAGNLPGDLHVWRVALDREPISFYFACDDGLREGADDGELITEISVQSFKPIRQRDYGITVFIGDNVTVIDVQHVGRLDERVVEVLVLRIDRMIDLK